MVRPAPRLVLSQIPPGHKSSAKQWSIRRLRQVDKKTRGDPEYGVRGFRRRFIGPILLRHVDTGTFLMRGKEG